MVLFVDTQSLYEGARRLYPVGDRVDYRRLAEYVGSTMGPGLWSAQFAFVVKKGDSYKGFADMLRSFGFEVIFVDKWVNDTGVVIEILKRAIDAVGVCLVTANRRHSLIVNHLITQDLSCTVVSFPGSFDHVELNDAISLRHIREEWMWRRE